MTGGRWHLVAAVLAAVLAAPAPVRAAEPASGSLSTADQRLSWKGQLTSGARDSYELDVQLPGGAWSEPGGVQVGIHWQYSSDDHRNLDLVVVGPGGTVVNASAGLDEDSETVLLPSAVNGPYRVEVRAGAGVALPYEGWVEVERSPPVQPVRDLLPNLVAMPQRQIGFPPNMEDGSCHGLERSEDGAKRCMRLEQSIANVGAGPMQIRYGFGHGAGGFQPLFQIVHRSDGTFYERAGDQWEFHDQHAHFHYKNFAMSQLWRADERGTILDQTPLRVGRKNGFCLLDVENIWWTRRGDGPKRHNQCAPVVQGISVGWADVYNYQLHGQYVEVSGIRDGHYVLETIADPPMPGAPGGSILESDETDNSAFVHIRLSGKRVDLLVAAASPALEVPPPAAPAFPQAAPPPPPRLAVSVPVRRFRAARANRRRTLSLPMRLREPVRDLRAGLFSARRPSRLAATGSLRRVNGQARLKLRLRTRIRRGSYLLKLHATRSDGTGADAVISVSAR